MPRDFSSYLETDETEGPTQKQAESLTFCVRLKYLSELGVFFIFIFHLGPEHVLKIREFDQSYRLSFRDLNFQINKIKYLMRTLLLLSKNSTYLGTVTLFVHNTCRFPHTSSSRRHKNFSGTPTNSVSCWLRALALESDLLG